MWHNMHGLYTSNLLPMPMDISWVHSEDCSRVPLLNSTSNLLKNVAMHRISFCTFSQSPEPTPVHLILTLWAEKGREREGVGCIHSSGAIIKHLLKGIYMIYNHIIIATTSLCSVRVVMVHIFLFIFWHRFASTFSVHVSLINFHDYWSKPECVPH